MVKGFLNLPLSSSSLGDDVHIFICLSLLFSDILYLYFRPFISVYLFIYCALYHTIPYQYELIRSVVIFDICYSCIQLLYACLSRLALPLPACIVIIYKFMYYFYIIDISSCIISIFMYYFNS